MGYAPNVDTSSTKSLVLDDSSFDAKLAAGHARRSKSSTTTANDEVIGLLGNGSHIARRSRQMAGN
jgi:hypothetical protein